MKEFQQLTDTILMIRPACFGYNEETAANNAFQSNSDKFTQEEVQQAAIREFDAFVEKLRAAGVEVLVFDDLPDPQKPDAVFPNNWVSFHQDGKVITYPMYSALRRKERRQDIIDELDQNFKITGHIHLEAAENEERFLEGTGSMILDRENKIIYACLSDRTNGDLLKELAKHISYEAIVFESVDRHGQPIYHTNVMMALGKDFAVVCMESLPNEADRKQLANRLKTTGKTLVEITFDQMEHFAGNMLQVRNKDGQVLLVMSAQAYDSLGAKQIDQLKAHTDILVAAIPTIETYGGGSVRCMMAEVFLPSRS